MNDFFFLFLVHGFARKRVLHNALVPLPLLRKALVCAELSEAGVFRIAAKVGALVEKIIIQH